MSGNSDEEVGNEVNMYIKDVLQKGQVEELTKILWKRKALNNCNSYLIYIFHLLETMGIYIVSIASSFNNVEIVWIGIACNFAASLLYVFIKVNDVHLSNFLKEIQAIKAQKYFNPQSFNLSNNPVDKAPVPTTAPVPPRSRPSPLPPCEEEPTEDDKEDRVDKPPAEKRRSSLLYWNNISFYTATTTTILDQNLAHQIEQILCQNKKQCLDILLLRRRRLLFWSRILIYLFHIMQTIGIFMTSFASSQASQIPRQRLLWTGIGCNLVASLLTIYEKILSSEIGIIMKDLYAIQQDNFLDESALVDVGTVLISASAANPHVNLAATASTGNTMKGPQFTSYTIH